MIMDWKRQLLGVRGKWYLKNYQGVRDFCVPVPKAYRDNTTHGLTGMQAKGFMNL